MGRIDGSRAGTAGVLGGITLIQFVLLKEWLLPAYGAGLGLGDGTGVAYHLLENVPLALIAVAMVGLLASSRSSTASLAAAGAATALVGAVAALVGHTAEHLLFVAGAGGPARAFMWMFYLGYLLQAVGLGVVGLGGRSLPSLGRGDRLALVATTPVAVLAAVVLGALWFRAAADGFKLPLAVAAVLVGYRLRWSALPTDDDPEVGRSEPSR